MNYRLVSCYHGDNMNCEPSGGVGVVNCDSIFPQCVTLPSLISNIDNMH